MDQSKLKYHINKYLGKISEYLMIGLLQLQPRFPKGLEKTPPSNSAASSITSLSFAKQK